MAKKKVNEKINLEVTLRNVFGKKLRKLRHQGVIPGNIYGTNYKSTAVALPQKEFIKIYRQAKGTSVVYLKLEKDEIPVLIKNVQSHPVTNSILHVDFRKIDLTQKVVTEVPVTVICQSEAVSQKGGVLLTQTTKLSVEALPQDIPQTIEVDISVIKEIGQEIKVTDLVKSTKYIIKNEPTKVVVSVTAHKEESITPETTTVTPEVISEKAPAEGEVAPAVTPEAGKETDKKPEASKPTATKPPS